MKPHNIILALILFITCNPVQALQLRQLVKVDGVIWGMTEVKPGQVLFTLREGKAGLLTLASREVQWLSNLPEVAARGQGGLLDVAQHKDWLYFTYSKPGRDGAKTTLSRAQLKNTKLVNWKDLLITRSATGTSRHFGSRIAFDHKGHVFFGVGDRGHRPNGQDLSTHAGSILRLNLDGSVPKDNPFTKQSGALPEIWSYGHRNPQGLCYNPSTKQLWSSEHGPRGGDEINLIEAGKNYGWPVVSHGKEYWNPLLSVGEATHKEGMEDPRHIYIPSIAPGSLLCYQGQALAQFKHHLLLGALKLTHLNSVQVTEGDQLQREQRWFEKEGERIRSLMQDKQGTLFIGTDSGRIFSVQP